MTVCTNTNTIGDVSGCEYRNFNSDESLAAVGLFQCYPEALLRFASACCTIFIVIGIPGNLITIVALARCKKVRNATAIFIINLHTVDLIFNCSILPMTAMTITLRHWTYGWVMCQMFAYVNFVLNTSCISTVLAISIIRYFIVCHPQLYPKLFKRRNISISIVIIWISAFAMFLAPIFGAWGRYNLEPDAGFCTLMPDKNCYSPKKFLLILAFVGPCLIIVLCYAGIWWAVQTAKKFQVQNARPARPPPQTQFDLSSNGRNIVNMNPSSSGSSTTESAPLENDETPSSGDSSVPQSPREDTAIEKYFKAPFRLTRTLVKRQTPSKRDKKLCSMIAAIMISFCMSHLPVMVTRLAYRDYKSHTILNMSAHLVEYSSTCINPIIYVLMSKEFRQAYQSLFEAIKYKFQTH